MNGKDKISVIIPCYNVQKYIMRGFDSIYQFIFNNLKLIGFIHFIMHTPQ